MYIPRPLAPTHNYALRKVASEIRVSKVDVILLTKRTNERIRGAGFIGPVFKISRRLYKRIFSWSIQANRVRIVRTVGTPAA